MDKNDIIRKNIKKAIEEAHLSKLRVASQAQISYKYFIQFLNNNRVGSLGIDILQRIAEVLNVPVSYFLGDADKDGETIYTINGKQLSEKWDQTIKAILEMPENEQEKILAIIDVFIKCAKKEER